MKALLDFIPLIAFFVVTRQQGIIAGAAAILIATVAVAVVHMATQKGRLLKQQWITLLLTVVFCGLTIMFQDDLFIKWKSTVINGVFALGLVVSLMIGKPLLKYALQSIFKLDLKGWHTLTWAWVGYFLLMAFLQYFFAFHTSDATWVNFKTYGWVPVMVVFMVGQFYFLRNHIKQDLNPSP